jgi:FkbM family methyltransferase
MAIDPLFDLLQPARLTAVVDIGANPIDGEPPYKGMLAARMCTLVGFEPQAQALARLNAAKSDLETYLPDAVGDGGAATLRICKAPGMTSLLAPEPRALACFGGYSSWGTVIEEISVKTRALGSIAEIGEMDFLKIDVQGAELAVFRGGRSRLQRAVAVQSEVSFVPLYRDQPSFGEIDGELRSLGFLPHAFAAINKRLLHPLNDAGNVFAALNQVIEADIVYVRDFTRMEAMDSQQLRHLALVAHHCYGSYDLALRCLDALIRRGEFSADAGGRYVAAIPEQSARTGAERRMIFAGPPDRLYP